MPPAIEPSAEKPITPRPKRPAKINASLFDDEDDFVPSARPRKLSKDVLLFDDIDLLSDE